MCLLILSFLYQQTIIKSSNVMILTTNILLSQDYTMGGNSCISNQTIWCITTHTIQHIRFISLFE
eukprot:UN00312